MQARTGIVSNWNSGCEHARLTDFVQTRTLASYRAADWISGPSSRLLLRRDHVQFGRIVNVTMVALAICAPTGQCRSGCTNVPARVSSE